MRQPKNKNQDKNKPGATPDSTAPEIISETKQIMRRYTVIARVGEIPPGVTIELSPAQSTSRIPYLEKLSEGIFRTSAMLQFMQGEEIGLTEVGMGQVHQLAIVEKKKEWKPTSL